jgi:hypothetical protein
MADRSAWEEVVTRLSIDARLAAFDAPWGQRLYALLRPTDRGRVWQVECIMDQAAKDRGKWIVRGVL